MADLRVLSTGKCFFRLDDGTAAVLLEMFPAAIERVNPKPAPADVPALPKWGVGIDAGGFAYLFYKVGGQITQYAGRPDKAIDGFKARRWSGEKQDYVFDGPEPPADILEQYRQQWAPRNAGE
jgi:hypothetical protein